MDVQHIVLYLIGIAVLMWIARAILRWWRDCKSNKCAACDDTSCPHYKKEVKDN
jgi:hypothetical protein